MSSGKLRVAVLLLAAAVAWGPSALAQVRANPSARRTTVPSLPAEEAELLAPSADQLRFANEYIKAVNAKDVKALRRLIAPKTLACYSPRTEPYLTSWLSRQTSDPISKPYSIKVQLYDENDITSSALFTLPVTPTHQLNITTFVAKDEPVVLGRPIAYLDGRWYETAPCPTDLGMEHFIDRQERQKKEYTELDDLYAKLRDPMKSNLKNLIAQNRIGEACTNYAQAEKIDFVTACKVVKTLAASMGIIVK